MFIENTNHGRESARYLIWTGNTATSGITAAKRIGLDTFAWGGYIWYKAGRKWTFRKQETCEY